MRRERNILWVPNNFSVVYNLYIRKEKKLIDTLKVLIYEIFLKTSYGKKKKKVTNFFDNILYFS